MTEKTEALRLAEFYEALAETPPKSSDNSNIRAAAAELRRLHADAEESEALRERLSALLRNTAIALRGPEPELTRWSWHDLPELAVALKAQRDALLEALKLARSIIGHPDDAHTQMIDAAIKAVEENT